MAVLSKQFADALTAIEPGDDASHAASAHAEVRDFLHEDEDLKVWGLSPHLIGSYKREVSIRRVKDVDVFCTLPGIPSSQDPQDLLDKVAGILEANYGGRVSKQDRSVKVEFPDYDMHVDVVPARPYNTDIASEEPSWEIPDKEGGWERTSPLRFGELSTARNTAHDGDYVPTVKLMRQTRRALLKGSKPGGLFVEIAAYHAFANLPLPDEADAPTSTAEFYTRTLEEMAPLIRGHANGTTPLMNPALLDQELQVRASDDEWMAIADAWEDAAGRARQACDSDDADTASEIFMTLLGQTSDNNQVFPAAPKDSQASAAVTSSLRTPGRDRLPSGATPTFG